MTWLESIGWLWQPISADLCISDTDKVLFKMILAAVGLLLIGKYIYKKLKDRGVKVGSMGKILRAPRFRKRDKMMFYTKRMLRHMNNMAAPYGRRKQRQMMLKFAKKMFNKKEQPQLRVKEPSQAFLEEDNTENREDADLPPDMLYIVRSTRIFGFLEKPQLHELSKFVERFNLKKGDMLFNEDNNDDSIYTIYSGRVSVFTREGSDEFVFKEVKTGDSIASFLSCLLVLANKESQFKTVAARALDDSKILRLRYKQLGHLLRKNPESMVRLVQLIMIRLQRVNFNALHNYLGLTTQMMKTRDRNRASLNVRSSSKKVSGIRGGNNMPQRPNSDIEAKLTALSKSSPTRRHLSILRRSSRPPYKVGTTGGSSKAVCGPTRHRKVSILSFTELPRTQMSETDCLKQAARAISRHLKLSSDSLILDKLSLQDYAAGENITTQNDLQHVNHLYYIVWGTVEVRQSTMQKQHEMFCAYPGDLIGVFETLTSEVPLFTRVATSDVRVASIPVTVLYSILFSNPDAVLHLAVGLIERLAPFLRRIDYALDWIQVDTGRAVYRQNDQSDAMYIILSGRLRSVVASSDGKRRMIAEYGRGELVGLVEVLTEAPRATTVLAVRDTELAKLPVGVLNVMKIKYPIVVTRLIQLLGQRLLGTISESDPCARDVALQRKTRSNFSTIALLPVSDAVPLHAFSMELHYALQSPSLRLTSEYIKQELGAKALDKKNEYRLCTWLGQVEDRHKILLYQCDGDFTLWTQRCIRQADCILIVAVAETGPEIGLLEQKVENLARRTQKELVVLHREGGPSPQNTVDWLNVRSWCSSHHHLRCSKRIFAKRSKLQEIYRKLEGVPCNVHSDFSRLARFLTGKSIGLVLGGGGARGCAHVGMIKAITEAGIPIDMIGGVSIGAFMGALWAQEVDLTTFTQKARDWALAAVTVWKQMFDVTYPITAWFTGKAFNEGIHATFGDKSIEDLWLPYFTVTTDISNSCPRIHRHGTLWSYVRASMTLAGILPPLCDPIDGHLLLDGGYVNNLPADVMYREMGAETIIAVDVGSQDETELTDYGDALSGWWLLFKRWCPVKFGEPVKIPDSAEIQSRLAYVSCVRQLEEVKASDYCTYVRPPIDRYKTLQFHSFNEIMDIGYQHGKTLFAGMKAVEQDRNAQILLKCTRESAQADRVSPVQSPDLKKPTSFTDIAEIICKIRRPLKDDPEQEIESYDDDYDVVEERGSPLS